MVNLLNGDSINGNDRNDTFFTALNTWIIIVQTPCLDVVLGQLSVSQQLHGVRHQHHIVPGKLLQLQVHPAHLTSSISNKLETCEPPNNLCVKRILV